MSNSYFAGSAGCSDGIFVLGDPNSVQIGPGNEFTGITQQGCGGHVDPIQLYGGATTIITGNYFHDNSTGVMSPDGDDGYVITNNVFHTNGYPWQVAMGGALDASLLITRSSAATWRSARPTTAVQRRCRGS